MDYWDRTADFDSHRTGLRNHLEDDHGIISAATCTPGAIIVHHLRIHHEPGVKADYWFPYGPGREEDYRETVQA